MSYYDEYIASRFGKGRKHAAKREALVKLGIHSRTSMAQHKASELKATGVFTDEDLLDFLEFAHLEDDLELLWHKDLHVNIAWDALRRYFNNTPDLPMRGEAHNPSKTETYRWWISNMQITNKQWSRKIEGTMNVEGQSGTRRISIKVEEEHA